MANKEIYNNYARAVFHIDREIIDEMEPRVGNVSNVQSRSGSAYGQLARRDLHRYYALLAAARAEIELSPREAVIVMEALKEGKDPQFLWAYVETYLSVHKTKAEALTKQLQRLSTAGAVADRRG